MPSISPVIILTNPQMGENIGASARAMANFGLWDLRLVNPREPWPNKKAHSLASKAFDKIVKPTLYDSLADALHDCQFALATTARRRDIVKPVFSPEQAMAETRGFAQDGKKVAFVFGPEQSGLDNDDLCLCNGIINIPTDPEFSSINLGQAVLLVSYEYSQTQAPAVFDHEQKSPPAKKETLFAFLDRLEDELEKSDFFKAAGLKPTMVRNIQNIFTRHDLTEQEVKTLQGILSVLIGPRDKQ